jgi:hypothetical protein
LGFAILAKCIDVAGQGIVDMFDGVLITDTFVLGWHREADELLFDVEASLWPEHPEYEQRLSGDWTCYKPSKLVFTGVRSVEGLPDMCAVPRSTDPDGSQDYGSLDELVAVPGGYRIVGDFGAVHVQATALRMQIGSRRL